LDKKDFLSTITEIGHTVSVAERSTSSNAAEVMQGKNDTDYRGKQNKTRSGKTCTAWKATATFTPKLYPDRGLDKNYCRNPTPDGMAKTIWCFTDGGDKAWDYCDPLTSSQTTYDVKPNTKVTFDEKSAK
jgi:hypothetical protein